MPGTALADTTVRICAYCGEAVVGDAIVQAGQFYCCQACATEAARHVDCGPDCHCNTPEKPLIR